MSWFKRNKSNVLFYGIFISIMLFLFGTTAGENVRAWMMSFTLSSPDLESQEIKSDKESHIDYDWKLIDDEGNELWISEIDKPIFLNIWATWCGPCRSEMASIMALEESMGNEVAILLVSTSDSFEKLKDYKIRKGIDFPLYKPAFEAPVNLRTKSFPTTFIIDKEKSVVMKSMGAHDWNAKNVHDYLRKLIDQ